MGISEYVIILYPAPESRRNGTTEPVAFMTVQTEESLVETCSLTGCCHSVLTSDCSTLCKAKLRWLTNVCRPTLGRSTHPCSRCGPQSRTSLDFLHRHAEFLQIWRCNVVLAFPQEDGSLENDFSPHRNPVEAAWDWRDVVLSLCFRH